jgi:hypothetical protein
MEEKILEGMEKLREYYKEPTTIEMSVETYFELNSKHSLITHFSTEKPSKLYGLEIIVREDMTQPFIIY